MFLAPFAVFFEFKLALNRFFILARPVINPFANGALHFYKIILGHFVRLPFFRHAHPLLQRIR